MNWWKRLSFQKVMLLTPLLILFLIMVSFGVLRHLAKNTFAKIEHTQQVELSKAHFFITIGHDLAQNHVQIHEHLDSAHRTVDEGEFYDNGKPLLLKIHSLEKRLQNYIDDNQSDIDVTPQLESLLQRLVDYRNNTTNSVLMATVDLGLSQELQRTSTSYYIGLNNQFLKMHEFVQERLANVSSSSHKSAEKHFSLIMILLFVVIGLLVLVGINFSQNLSRIFHNRILALNNLAAQDKPESVAYNSNNELDVLSEAIENVKYNFKLLDETRQELSEKEKDLRAVLDNMLDGVITIDEKGKVLTFNNAAEVVFGYKADEVIGGNISQLMPESYAHQHDRYLQNYISTGEAQIIGVGREVTGLKKNGETFPMHLSIGELPHAIDGKKCFIGSCQDITLFKQQEEQLRRSQKMDALGKLTGGIAHDFNNLLNIIIGYSHILETKLAGQRKLAMHAKEINHAGERGAKLTQKLLAFSRQKETVENKLDINSLLKDEQHMLQKTLTARIKLVYECADNLWPVYLDSNDFEDALINLCINAMHAMKNQGQLTIQTHNQHLSAFDARQINLAAGDYACLSVSDTGCGMDETIKDKIFDPFFSTKGEQGTGLGLSQVYGFVERSQGAVKVYSEPGHGTRFVFYFPRHIELGVPEDENDILESEDYRGSETILVVDDEPALLGLVTEILQPEGYTVITAESGVQALEIIEGKSIDLLLSDVIMSEMDGYELSAIVQNKYPSIKIQLASGFNDNRHLKLSNDLLHLNILHKPYTSNSLLARIRAVLDEKNRVRL